MTKENIQLRPWENLEYEIIRDYVEGGEIARKSCIISKLDICSKTLKNMVNGYKSEGKAWFIHGNRGRKPIHALSDDKKDLIINTYTKEYPDASYAHATELLKEDNIISISKSTVRNILLENDITSPFVTKKTRRCVAKRLREKALLASKKEMPIIAEKIEKAENTHPKREKSAYFGQMLQLDASQHIWFNDIKCFLHCSLDDATGTLTSAYFDEQETLNGYYNITYQVLTKYGIPALFYTDGRTVFEYKKKNEGKNTNTADYDYHEVEKDHFTQFGYACKHLGIDIITTHIPQAKGKVERLWGTLQKRIPIDFRRAGINSIDEANAYLKNHYIDKFNEKFALPYASFPSLFVEAPPTNDIMKILAVISERVIDNGHSIRYHNQSYRTIGHNGLPCYLSRKTKGLVIESFDKKLFFSIASADKKESIYLLEVIPEHEHISRAQTVHHKKDSPREVNIPKTNHPWRLDSWKRHLKRQKHRTSDSLAI
ncbi:MAG: ISNCY family transposase [Lachnospiraceae bacterium]|nr:ISNCY family transposase [Lachnospiraceae bacterium]